MFLCQGRIDLGLSDLLLPFDIRHVGIIPALLIFCGARDRDRIGHKTWRISPAVQPADRLSTEGF
jgi:hypothetical protein